MRLICLDTLEFRGDCTLDVIVGEAPDGCKGVIYAYVFDGYVKIFAKIQDFYNWKFENKDVIYFEITQDEYNKDIFDEQIKEMFFGISIGS